MINVHDNKKLSGMESNQNHSAGMELNQNCFAGIVLTKQWSRIETDLQE